MAKDAGKKSFLDFFKVKNIDDDEDEFDDDLFDDDDYDDDDDDDYEDVKPRASKSKPSFSPLTILQSGLFHHFCLHTASHPLS